MGVTLKLTSSIEQHLSALEENSSIRLERLVKAEILQLKSIDPSNQEISKFENRLIQIIYEVEKEPSLKGSFAQLHYGGVRFSGTKESSSIVKHFLSKALNKGTQDLSPETVTKVIKVGKNRFSNKKGFEEDFHAISKPKNSNEGLKNLIEKTLLPAAKKNPQGKMGVELTIGGKQYGLTVEFDQKRPVYTFFDPEGVPMTCDQGYSIRTNDLAVLMNFIDYQLEIQKGSMTYLLIEPKEGSKGYASENRLQVITNIFLFALRPLISLFSVIGNRIKTGFALTTTRVLSKPENITEFYQDIPSNFKELLLKQINEGTDFSSLIHVGCKKMVPHSTMIAIGRKKGKLYALFFDPQGYAPNKISLAIGTTRPEGCKDPGTPQELYNNLMEGADDIPPTLEYSQTNLQKDWVSCTAYSGLFSQAFAQESAKEGFSSAQFMQEVSNGKHTSHWKARQLVWNLKN